MLNRKKKKIKIVQFVSFPVLYNWIFVVLPFGGGGGVRLALITFKSQMSYCHTSEQCTILLWKWNFRANFILRDYFIDVNLRHSCSSRFQKLDLLFLFLYFDFIDVKWRKKRERGKNNKLITSCDPHCIDM